MMGFIKAVLLVLLAAASPPAKQANVPEQAARYAECRIIPAPIVEAPPVEAPENECRYIGDWTVTAYCPCSACNGGYTGTASGAPLTPYRTAASNSLPFGTRVLIGDSVWCIEDTGYSPYGDAWIDILLPTHEEALAWGVRTVSVYIVE